jgi:hypothetical protein
MGRNCRWRRFWWELSRVLWLDSHAEEGHSEMATIDGAVAEFLRSFDPGQVYGIGDRTKPNGEREVVVYYCVQTTCGD